jgi:hypothetical protein
MLVSSITKAARTFFYHNQGVAGGGQYDRSLCVEQFTYQPNNLFPTIKMTSYGSTSDRGLNPYQRVEAEKGDPGFLFNIDYWPFAQEH